MGLYGSGLTQDSTARAMMIHMYMLSANPSTLATAKRKLFPRIDMASPA